MGRAKGDDGVECNIRSFIRAADWAKDLLATVICKKVQRYEDKHNASWHNPSTSEHGQEGAAQSRRPVSEEL